ncbi:MAG: hypothetical protein WC969_03605 [Elusimicrobiota bacterium]|jgi:hypothetical protein
MNRTILRDGEREESVAGALRWLDLLLRSHPLLDGGRGARPSRNRHIR